MAIHMYVSLQDDDRIVRFVVDRETGKLEQQGAVEVAGGPLPWRLIPLARRSTSDSGGIFDCPATALINRPAT